MLEQQFVGFAKQTQQRILQISAGFSYSYDTTQPAGSRVSDLRLNGAPIDPTTSYRVTTNDYLANGGDGCTLLTGGTARTTAPVSMSMLAYLWVGAPVAPAGRPDHPFGLSNG